MNKVLSRAFVIRTKWIVCCLMIAGLGLCFLSGCGQSKVVQGSQVQTEEIVVFAAASLTESFSEIKRIYEKNHPNVEIVYNFAGSQVLNNQIKQGAEPAMFFSANEKYVDELISLEDELFKGNLELQKNVFAANELTVVVEQSVQVESFEALLVLLAKDKSIPVVIASDVVPVGRYTKKMMDVYLRETGNHNNYDGFYESIVSYESDVKAVLTKVKIHEAKVCVVYQTDAKTIDMDQSQLKSIEIPKGYNQQATYGSIKFENGEEASAFYNFVIDGEGKGILNSYGFK